MKTTNETANSNAIDILEFCTTKRHIAGLQNEGINSDIYNELFAKGCLSFTVGKGNGLYLETTDKGKQILATLKNQLPDTFALEVVKKQLSEIILGVGK